MVPFHPFPLKERRTGGGEDCEKKRIYKNTVLHVPP